MKQSPTLEDLQAQLDAQNAELIETTRLAETISLNVMLDERALAAFDECVDAAPTGCAQPACYGIRA